MEKIKLISLIFFFLISAHAEIIPVERNIFFDTETGQEKEIKRDFVLITLNEVGVGRYYYIDSYNSGNTVIWSNRISAGQEPTHSTPSGIYKIYHKKRRWMSTKFPDPSGINNMNYSMFFKGGIALHQGNVYANSHGCIHIKKCDVKILFRHLKIGTPVVVTRESYIPFLTNEDKDYIFRKDNNGR